MTDVAGLACGFACKLTRVYLAFRLQLSKDKTHPANKTKKTNPQMESVTAENPEWPVPHSLAELTALLRDELGSDGLDTLDEKRLAKVTYLLDAYKVCSSRRPFLTRVLLLSTVE